MSVKAALREVVMMYRLHVLEVVQTRRGAFKTLLGSRDDGKVFVDTENVEIAQVLMGKEIFLWTRSA